MTIVSLKRRDTSFDVLRGMSILLVIYIHVSTIGLRHNPDGANFYLTIVLRQMANFAVPLFFFVSGYFLSRKTFTSNKDYFSFLLKQIPRVVIPLIVWSIIYSIVNGLTIKSTLLRIFTFTASFHFYFIFAICQFYVLLPLIKRFLVNRNGLIISFLVSAASCLSIGYFRYKMGNEIPLIIYGGSLLTWLIFPVLGMYIASKGTPTKLNFNLIGLVSALIISVLVSISIYYNFGDINNGVSAVKVSSFLYSVFAILCLLAIRPLLSKSKFFEKAGHFSFGIYFSHMLFLSPINRCLRDVMPIELYSNVFTQLIIAFGVFLLAFSLGLILIKINKEFSSKYLGY